MRLWPVLILLALIPPAHAEMAGDEYQTEAGGLNPEEREAARKRLAEEIAAERARAEEAARKARDEAEQYARERAARPLGERLVETRCQVCHDRAQIERARYGTLGWTITVLRMQLLNGARLESGERRVVVRHLAAGETRRSRREWALSGAVLLVLAGLGLGLRRILRRRG